MTLAWRITAVTQKARIPASWLVKAPAGMTTFDAMSYGTASFTAALAVIACSMTACRPQQAGAGEWRDRGVGMVAIEILANWATTWSR